MFLTFLNFLQETFKDTKGTIRNRTLKKHMQCNGQN